MAGSLQKRKISPSVFYQITIEGAIREDWSDWMNSMVISIHNGIPESQTTVLTGQVTDQSALRGLLCRLWDLNLTIISIFRLERNTGAKEGEK